MPFVFMVIAFIVVRIVFHKPKVKRFYLVEMDD
jgi:hypothetical protein